MRCLRGTYAEEHAKHTNEEYGFKALLECKWKIVKGVKGGEGMRQQQEPRSAMS